MSSTDLAREAAHKPQQTTVHIAAVQYLLSAVSD